MSCLEALAAFRSQTGAAGWGALPVFAPGGAAEQACAAADAERAAGHVVAPAPERVFAALSLTPLESVRVVILGQDPYPTPGHANGLAFSYVGPPPLPRSLVNIFRERQADLGLPPALDGDLTPWARQGVLLLNTALTVREGASKAGSHLLLGWGAVTDAIIAAVHVDSSRGESPRHTIAINRAEACSSAIDRSVNEVMNQSICSSLSSPPSRLVRMTSRIVTAGIGQTVPTARCVV